MSGHSLPAVVSTAWNRLARPRHASGATPDAATRAPQGFADQPAASTDTSQASDEVTYPGLGTLFLAWSAIAILTSSRHYFQPVRPGPFDLAIVIVYVACFAPWAVLTPLAFRLERRHPLGTSSWPRHLAALALWSVPIALVGSALMFLSATVGWAIVGRPRDLPSDLGYWLRVFPVAEVCFWCGIAVGYFIRTLYQLRSHERRAARLALEKSQLEAGLNQAQLEVLRAKLNPHFLFNSLQNISVLTGQDPETASRMLTRLGELLRAVLRRDSSPESTLSEELELTQSYIALEQLRFGDRLRVVFDIAPDVQAALVPCFILQPLIENAVVHGLRSVKKDGLITVAAAREDCQLVLRVLDNGVGLRLARAEPMKMGVGLGSTRERLERMFPNRHTCVIRALEEGGTEVRISVPLRFDADEAVAADE